MASQYMRPTPWQRGTTVAVYAGSVATGAPVSTAVVRKDNSILIPDLTAGAPYIAVGSGQSVLFTAGDVAGGGGGGGVVTESDPVASSALVAHAALTGNGTHVPSAGVTDTHVSDVAGIVESKLVLASDAAAGTASRRTLGTGAQQAAAGTHGHSPSTLGWTGSPAAGMYPDGGGAWTSRAPRFLTTNNATRASWTGAVTIDMQASSVPTLIFEGSVTLTGATTLTLTNMAVGARIDLDVAKGATAYAITMGNVNGAAVVLRYPRSGDGTLATLGTLPNTEDRVRMTLVRPGQLDIEILTDWTTSPVVGVTYQRGVYIGDGAGGRTQVTNADPRVGANPVNDYPAGWKYPSSNDLNYVAAQNYKLVHLATLLERLAPTLSGALSATELNRIRTITQSGTGLAVTKGLKVAVQFFNKGEYYTASGAQAIGTTGYPTAAYADACGRLADALLNDDGCYAISIMNEPNKVGTANYTDSAASTWQTISQAAVTAIMATGWTKKIIVPLFWFSNPTAVAHHPGGPWITGVPSSQLMYECHHYFDSAGVSAGDYTTNYAQNLAAATAAGFSAGANADAFHTRVLAEIKQFADWLKPTGAKGFIGEVGGPNATYVPSPAANEQALWDNLWERWYQFADQQGWDVTAWQVGRDMLQIMALHPPNQSPFTGPPRPQNVTVAAHPTQ